MELVYDLLLFVIPVAAVYFFARWLFRALIAQWQRKLEPPAVAPEILRCTMFAVPVAVTFLAFLVFAISAFTEGGQPAREHGSYLPTILVLCAVGLFEIIGGAVYRVAAIRATRRAARLAPGAAAPPLAVPPKPSPRQKTIAWTLIAATYTLIGTGVSFALGVRVAGLTLFFLFAATAVFGGGYWVLNSIATWFTDTYGERIADALDRRDRAARLAVLSNTPP